MILVTMQVAILGRQPEISIAELEALFGANKINKMFFTGNKTGAVKLTR